MSCLAFTSCCYILCVINADIYTIFLFELPVEFRSCLAKPSSQRTPGYGHHKKETSVGRHRITRQSTADRDGDEGVTPSKLNGSSVETPSYQNLQRELLLSHKRGLVLEEKPELTRVLEQRRLELHKEEEMAQRRPSDLETELRKRQQKMQEVRGGTDS
uniref:protein FAM107B isoform X2 n=1 Tax=Gasterosteus aculeatus aculeatus TaxID=481459 RepID=UPI001A990FE1|nr:protein FAM107B isoform X2 [Gasterosteus aculeatus aculeatus]